MGAGTKLSRIQVVLILGFFSFLAQDIDAKSLKVFKVNSSESIPKTGARRLNYPELPDFSKLSEENGIPKNLTAKNRLLAQQWGLATLGFFDVYDPFLNPINPAVVPCSKKITVAIVDTGIDYTEPDLAKNLWVNSGETGPWKPVAGSKETCRDKSCNGMDDDNNGFIDDVVGWDFVHNTPLPYDTHGHGTHIAGIIASRPNSDSGVIGLCSNVSLMILKYYDSSAMGYNNLSNTVRAIQYAVDNGAQIINYSGGGNDPAPSEKVAIGYARSKGVLFVAAAGNNGFDNGSIPYYPASYPLDNIISVASIDKDEQLLSSSNFGYSSVDIAAPGMNILSTLPNGKRGGMSGTSQATAFVTGAAAFLASQTDSEKFNYKKIKEYLLQSARPLPKQDEEGRKIANGILSLPAAVLAEQKDTLPQSAPTIPSAIARNRGGNASSKIK